MSFSSETDGAGAGTGTNFLPIHNGPIKVYGQYLNKSLECVGVVYKWVAKRNGTADGQ